ncbi:phosphoethanolamine transferase [Glaciecola sp. 33A]|uniref:phosphoethanolamine transferase n=1 Tax=Glaciecola sp. 33A TaxID=2057807 RepID=UPI000C3499B3|nr:phosphoethanolamine--lipid A transferase [Glaciecola sp. 33A]PKI00218.1 phosphoethanolamine transferase [Glaciecola sp. 33A]
MKYINTIRNRSFSTNQLILFTSAYIALVLNLPFFTKVWNIVTANSDYNIWFLLSVPLVLLLLTILFHSLFAFKRLLKPMLIASVCLSSLLFYGTYHYGIIFDYGMIQNTIDTDHAEVMSYFNMYAVLFFVLFGLLPSSLLYYAKITDHSIVKGAFGWLKMVVIATLLLSILVSLFYVNYAAVGRNNRELTSYLTPFKLYESSYKYLKRALNNSPREFHILDAKPVLVNKQAKRSITVVVLGETARAKNFSLNGYDKTTNKYTQGANVVSFSNVSSCGTATAVSVPCMFSRLNKQNYDKYVASYQQNVLDIIQLSGTNVTWIDNNNGGCKGVCARVESIVIDENMSSPLCDGEYCIDEILLEYLDKQLLVQSDKNTLIVLHMMGSHGPTYFRRYPPEHRAFTPDCQRSDIQHCTSEELINTYDNTILYTDFVLAKITQRLQTLSDSKQVNTAMLYVSDHGESLGENGIYLHGLPYAFAPKEQTHVPMLFWQNKQNEIVSQECLDTIATQAISHDNFFDILLGIQSVDSNTYNAKQDVLSLCRQTHNLANRDTYAE